MSPKTETAGPGPLLWPDARPELLPFLPLVYVAWSDGALSASELGAIRDRLERWSDWLDAEARAALAAWLDPAHPPTAAALVALRERLRGLGGDAGARRSLVELGIALARARGAEGPWADPGAQAALAEVERELGTAPREAVRKVLADVIRVPAEAPKPPAETEAPGLAEIRDLLQEPHADLRRRVLSLLEEEPFVFPVDIQRPERREQVLAAVRRIAEEGLGGLAYPREVGGADDPGGALAVFETLAFGDSSVVIKYGVQFGLFGGSILNLGTERHHRAYLPRVGTLELPGSYAMTETGHGSNVRDLETTARYDAATDELVVDTPSVAARKDWIGNAALHGRMATVFVRLTVGGEDHGVHAVLVPIRDEQGRPMPGVEIEDRGAKVGLEGIDNGLLHFREVRVPRENLLDRFASIDEQGRYTSPIPSADRRFFTMLGTLVAGRISIAAASVSAAKVGLTVAVRWCARRRQFGPTGGPEVPLLSYLSMRRKLLIPLAATYGLHFAVRSLSERYAARQAAQSAETAPRALQDAGTAGETAPGDEEGRRIEVEAAGLKAYASWHCVATLQACREACGGEGYRAVNRLGRLRADTDIFTTFEGANAVLLQLVAKGLLSQYREEMGDLRLWGLVRHLADRAGNRLAERNPVAVRRTDPDHLRDPEMHAAAFEYREQRLLASAGRRLRALIQDGVDSFDAMNRVQDHLLSLAEAHVDRIVLGAFREAVARAPSPAASERLDALSSLWALSRLETERGWFLESGYFEGAKARAIRGQVNALCEEVAEQAEGLVDAFGIPDAVLRAPAGIVEG